MSDGGESASAGRTLIFVCHGPSCSERGSPETCRRLREAIAASPARRALRVCETGCLDNCATGPNVLVSHERLIRTGVLPAETAGLLELLLGPAGGPVDGARAG